MNPSMGLIRDLMPRWSCSTRLFRYFEDRSVMRFQRLPSAASSCTARCEGAYCSPEHGFVYEAPYAARLWLPRYISIGAQAEVYGVAVLIDCTIVVHPSLSHPHVRLVYTPGSIGCACKAVPPLSELQNVALYPTQDRSVRKLQTALRHHHDQIAQAELIRRYQRTHKTMISQSKCRPANKSAHALQPAHPAHLVHRQTLAILVCTGATS